MNIVVVGTGYVGLVTAVCLADKGHTVTAVDIDKRKIESLRRGAVPIYEPGLEEMLGRLLGERLFFTTNLAGAVPGAEVVFLAVGTPSLTDGSVDLSQVDRAAAEIGQAQKGYLVVVNKSTVPVGTADRVADLVSRHQAGPYPFDVVSNPEFLREGSALEDFLNGDRVVIGVNSARARRIMEEIYRPFDIPLIITDVRSAEMIKYAANAFLATKISFINEIANLCDRLGADVREVARGIGADHRINPYFLNAGLGFGGSCFPKDTKAFLNTAKDCGYNFSILEAVIRVNERQRFIAVTKLEESLGKLHGRQIGIWGLTFKPHTDDMRCAPSLDIIEALRQRGAVIRAYDPVALDKARDLFPAEVELVDSPYLAAEGADGLVLVTEWPQFREVDLLQVRKLMRVPLLIDGRNFFDHDAVAAAGFRYRAIGRPAAGEPAEVRPYEER